MVRKCPMLDTHTKKRERSTFFVHRRIMLSKNYISYTSAEEGNIDAN